MRTKSIRVLFFLLILGCNSFAQSVISEDKDIIQFLNQMKEIEDVYRCSVFAVNLLTFKGF